MLKIKNSIHIYFISFLTGIITGCFIILFSKILSYAENFFPFLNVSANSYLTQGFNWQYLFLPVLGGLLVGFITHYYCPEAKGNGIDNVLDAFHNRDGEMRGRVSVYKSIVTILTLSLGGSAGKEGPAAQIGASIGSSINDFFGGGARARRTMLLAGVSASLGTIFQAPLGGALTAIEMVYKEDLESDALIPSIISSVSAYFLLSFFGVIHRDLFPLDELSVAYLPFYPILGFICFLIGFLLVNFIKTLRAFFAKWKIYPPLKPAIGGLVCGIIYLFFPIVSGTGENFIHKFLLESGLRSTFAKLDLIYFILFVIGFKVIATSFTIASGGSGGIFGPSLFLGGSIGMLTAEFVGVYYQLDSAHYQSFVLVGMGAFYAGIASAPIAAMIMICEMIGSYVLLPPLMLCSILVVLLSKKFNLYQAQTHNRFHSPAHAWDIQTDVLKTMPVFRYKKFLLHSLVVSLDKPLSSIKKELIKFDDKDFVVVDSQNKYVGMITSLQLTRIENKKQFKSSISLIHPIRLEESIGDALNLLKEKHLDKAPIVNEENEFVGYLRYHEILELYFAKK
ncbi:MAG: chloride channel protein [Leptospiraceae bacterium]|nr:chloride channel protein [Leptospiraceae bacterium]MBK7054116.1 chloride channel protein [Leptospiraceae bacterium]MBK9499760.1 chloride channel protein [Leptospiraceae bacterium]